MDKIQEEEFRETAHIGDLVTLIYMIPETLLKDGGTLRRSQQIEGYVARHGWRNLVLSEEPIQRGVGFLEGLLHKSYPYQRLSSKYQIEHQEQCPSQ